MWRDLFSGRLLNFSVRLYACTLVRKKKRGEIVQKKRLLNFFVRLYACTEKKKGTGPVFGGWGVVVFFAKNNE